MNYYMFLKTKRGDRNSLRNLNNENIIPFFDLVTKTLNNNIDDIKNKQNDFKESIYKYWNKSSQFYIDHFNIELGYRYKDGSHPYSFYEEIIKNGYKCGLCLGVDRDEDYLESIDRTILNHPKTNIAIRLLLEDISVPRLIMEEVKELYNRFKTELNNIIIVIDLRIIEFPNIDKIVQKIHKFIDILERLNKYIQVVITSSSIPMDINSVLKTGQTKEIQRLEAKLWNDVSQLEVGNIELVYGDYGVVSPDFLELDTKGIPIPIAPKITYTTHESYIISRGKKVSLHDRGYKQFKDLASSLITHNFFRDGFSYGDDYIKLISDPSNNKSGNAETWITATMNQHINFISSLIGSA